MEEETQHEAAGQQPATEVWTAGQPEAEPATQTAGEVEASLDSPADEASLDDVLSEEAVVADPDDEILEDADVPAESEDELAEDAPLPQGNVDADADSDSDGGSDPALAEEQAQTSINAFELIGSTGDQATEAETDAATLKAVLEAIVYVLPEPVPAAQIAAALNQPQERVESILRELMDDTARPERGVFVREVAGGYQVATKPEHHEAIRNFVKNLKQPLKLSNAALETLAVIAYKQPVTAPEIMEIRGVQGVGVLKTLLDRKLITTAGRKNVIGKPILYKTTKEFLTQFGLNRLSELPTLKEFEEIRRQSMSDDEMEDRPEAHMSAPLLQQAAAIDLDSDSPAGETPAEVQELAEERMDDDGAPAQPVVEPETPPTPESGPDSQENHG